MKNLIAFIFLLCIFSMEYVQAAFNVNYDTNLSEVELESYKRSLDLQSIKTFDQKIIQLSLKRAALTNRFSKVSIKSVDDGITVELKHKIKVESISIVDDTKSIDRDVIESIQQSFIIQSGDYLELSEKHIKSVLKDKFRTRGYEVSLIEMVYENEEDSKYRSNIKILIKSVKVLMLSSISLVDFSKQDVEALIYFIDPPDNILKRFFYRPKKINYLNSDEIIKNIAFEQRYDELGWQKIIKDFSIKYRLKKYYDFKVNTSISWDAKNFNLRIKLSKGLRYKINYLGNIAFWDRELRELLEQKYHTNYLNYNADESRRVLLDKYLKKGFKDVKIDIHQKQIDNINFVTFTINEGSVYYVDDVLFSGAEYIDLTELNSIKEEYLSELFSLADKPVFYSSQIENSKEYLCNVFRKHGYYFCKIRRLKFIYSKYRNLVRLKYFIDPGDKVFISEINYPESISNYDFERIVVAGQKLNPNAIAQQLRALTTYFDNLGFVGKIIDQNLTNIVKIEKNSNQAILKFNVDLGKQVYLGRAIVAGNYKVKDKVILRELGSRTIRPGDTWSVNKVKNLEEALLGLGLFSDVQIESFGERDTSMPSGDSVITQDMRITVKESYSGGIEFGPGFRTDEGFIGFAEFNYNNLWNTNRAISVTSKISRKVSDSLFVAQKYSVSYLEPYLFGFKSRLRLLASYEKSDKTTREEGEQVGGFALQEFSLKSNLDFYVLNSLRVVLDLYKIDLPEVFNFLPSDSSADTEKFKIASTGINLIYDKRNNIFNPKKGYLLSSSFTYANPVIGSDKNADFLLSESRFSFYHPFSTDSVLAFSAAYGRLWSQGEASTIPPSERFFLGGATSIRSLSERFLGSSEEGVLNQESYQVKLEYRQTIFAKYLISPFVDGGYVNSFSKGRLSNGELPKWRWAAGLGFRYDTPIGPVAFDIGFNLNPQLESEDSVKVHFSVGSF